MEQFSLLLVSCEVFTSLCLCTTAAFVGLASSKKTDKVMGILSAVYTEDVCSKRKVRDSTLPFDLLYTKIESTSANVFNESLEADDVFSQLTQ